MNTVRENFILFFLALIAVIAIIIALTLQLTIITNQGSATENVQSGNNSSNSTGAIIIIATATREPTSLTAAQPTLAPPAPVPPTPIPTVTVPPAVLPPTKPESDRLIPDTPTVDTQPISTMTPIPTASSADLRLGYIERDITNCNFFTQILKQLLEEEAGLEIGIVEFRDVDALYAQLASTEKHRPIDLTLCFTDPDDRDYIHKYFGYTKLIGSAYWQNDTARLQIIANASMVAQLRKSQPCLYNLLQNLNFDDLTSENMFIDQWLAENPQPLQTWVRCDLN